ncbi:MAG: AraC family transcriptional regulator [Candidatus Thiodiazotropha sp. (ex Ctena orbiculata)]|nr:AraC family transcriptional regulator [Candidatus Thiodiazotropha taylori]
MSLIDSDYSHNHGASGDDIANHIDGHCTLASYGFDLEIHANDSLEMSNAHASFELAPKLTVLLMLEGDLDATINDYPLGLSALSGPAGYLWINHAPARLDRWIRAGQRVRKVIASIPLDNFALLTELKSALPEEVFRDTKNTLTLLRWRPNDQAIRYAEEIMSAGPARSTLDKLTTSIAALNLLRFSMTHLERQSASNRKDAVGTRDAKRARQVREYALANIGQPLSINEIADSCCMSVSTLQRVFKSCYGCTVMEFLRIRRLELARLAMLDEGLSVGEAAYRAGYSNPANFSTAFQRRFGYPPSACLDTFPTRT